LPFQAEKEKGFLNQSRYILPTRKIIFTIVIVESVVKRTLTPRRVILRKFSETELAIDELIIVTTRASTGSNIIHDLPASWSIPDGLP